MSFGFPVLLLVVQIFLICFACRTALRGMGILRKPYNGMDYGLMLYAASLMLGMLVIAASNAENLFQSARVYMDSSGNPFQQTILQFTKLFFIVLITGLLFLSINYANFKLIAGGNKEEPGMPVSILLSSIALGSTVLFWIITKELTNLLTPKILGI